MYTYQLRVAIVGVCRDDDAPMKVITVPVGAVLTVATIMGLVSPRLLLVLTFALSAGDAFETPTWRAILPELVKKEDLAATSALNGIEFNIARATGPALAGVLIASAGIGPAIGSFQ